MTLSLTPVTLEYVNLEIEWLNLSRLIYTLYKMGVDNHWTGPLDWTIGPDPPIFIRNIQNGSKTTRREALMLTSPFDDPLPLPYNTGRPQ